MGAVGIEPSFRDCLLRYSDWKLVSSLLPTSDVPPLDAHGFGPRLKACQKHFHSSRQIVIALEGESTYVLGGKVYPWRPGTFFFQDVYETHDDGLGDPRMSLAYLEIMLYERCFTAMVVRFRGGRRDEVATELVPTPFQLDAPLEQIWLELSSRRDLPAPLARMLLFSVTLQIVERFLDEENRGVRQVHILGNAERVDRICESMRHTGARGATLESVAQIAGYSRSHFARVFRHHTGMSVHDYIDLCRAEKAEELAALGLTHAQVAAALGFSRPSAFARWQREQQARTRKRQGKDAARN